MSKFKSNILPSAYISSPQDINGVNENPIRHTSTGLERRQQQSLKTVSAKSMKNTRPTFSVEYQPDLFPRSSSPFNTAIQNSTPVAAAVTPSPKSQGNRGDEIANASERFDSAAIPFVEKGNGTWRNCGKLFRANIVLADEDNGAEIFDLNDSCAIERYYRVADRVLEQFLSSNIAERNDLIESYLVGNRLFKFLSVVLPTHHQYFSSNPKLEELRYRSEKQFMDLLECMEELELMIDEMEYNRYILKDLTPSETKDNSGGGKSTTNEIPKEDWVVNGNFLHGFSESKRSDHSDNDTMIIAAKPEITTERNEEWPSKKQPQQNIALHSNQINDAHRKFQGGSVKLTVQTIEASYQKQKNSKPSINDSPNQHELLKQRVAAVVKASNNAALSTDSLRSIRCVSSRPSRSVSSSSKNAQRKSLDSLPDKNHVEFKAFSQNDSNSIDYQGLFQDTSFHPNRPEAQKTSNERQRHKQDTQALHDLQMSWDADFSQFNAFSEKIEDFAGLKTKNTNIDLLMQDPGPVGKMQSERTKSLPKIKKPPVSHPRSVWGHAQVHAARLSSSVEGNNPNTNEHMSAFSDCSSDIFYSLENAGLSTEPVKMKIEERLERGMNPQNIPPGGKNMSLAFANFENSSVLEAKSQRKLRNQFRGCVKFLID